MHPVVKQFLENIKEYKMFEKGDRVIVGVSGGADSIALLYLINEIKKEYELEIYVAHLNHKFRGSEADQDEEYVKTLARRMDVPIMVESFDVQSYAKRNNLGFEEAARMVRHDFYERLRLDIKADKIALGHTADDNIETFLMRLVRGAGSTGLCGIPPVRGKIVRPLIMVWRYDIEKFCASVKLVPRVDYTNYDTRYLRNRVRMKLIPELKLFNPKIKDILLQTILLVTSDTYFIRDRVKEAFESVLDERKEVSLTLNIKKLREYDQVIQNHVIRAAIEEIKGNLENVYFIHIDQIVKSLAKSERQEFKLADGIYVVSGRDDLVFTTEKPQQESRSFEYEVDVPGEIYLKESGMRIKAEYLNITGTEIVRSYNPYEALVDASKVHSKIIARSRQPGDRFSPLGLGGTKKLQDLFVDAKVPLAERDKIPVIEEGGRIIWVVGSRIDENYKVNSDSTRILRISAQESIS